MYICIYIYIYIYIYIIYIYNNIINMLISDKSLYAMVQF